MTSHLLPSYILEKNHIFELKDFHSNVCLCVSAIFVSICFFCVKSHSSFLGMFSSANLLNKTT